MDQSLCNPDHNPEFWWRDWFNQVYLDVYAHRNEGDAQKEVNFAVALLGIMPDFRVLDLCCGNGRHSRALRREGFESITGLDYSAPLLQHACAEPPLADYLRGDMRRIPLRTASQDVVLSFFTSFGYFPTDTENHSVLYEIARVLRPEGKFLLDYLNPAYVRKHFVAETVRQQGEIRIREQRSFTADGQRVEKEILIENWSGQERCYHESVRLYEYEQMTNMLHSANLNLSGVLGDFRGLAHGPDSPRMILFGKSKR